MNNKIPYGKYAILAVLFGIVVISFVWLQASHRRPLPLSLKPDASNAIVVPDSSPPSVVQVLSTSNKTVAHEYPPISPLVTAEKLGSVGQLLINTFPTNGRPAILAWLLETNSIANNLILVARLTYLWAENEPQNASMWIEQISDPDIRSEIIQNVISFWTNAKYSEQGTVEPALNWVKLFPDPGDRQVGLKNLAYQEASHGHPLEALDLSAELTDQSSRNDLIEYAAGQWASTSPRAASNWAAEVPDLQLRDNIVKVVSIVWCDKDPAAALDLALTLPFGRQKDDAVLSIAARWKRQGVLITSARFPSLPKGTLSDAALNTLTTLPTP